MGGRPEGSRGRDGSRRSGGEPEELSHALRVLEFPRVLGLVARRAISGLGADHVRSLRPLARRAAVAEELAAVEEMAGIVREEEAWAPPAVPDVRDALRALGVEGTLLDEGQLIGIGRLLAASRDARRDLSRAAGQEGRLGEISDSLVTGRELRERLERSFDESGGVADGASPRLGDLRDRLRRRRSELVDRLEEFARGLSDRIRVPEGSVTVRSGRYCIPVRREGRSEVGGIVHDESASGQTLFVEPPLAIDPMNRVRELEEEERREVRRVLRELTEAVRPSAAELSGNLDLLIEVDSLHARARYLASHGGAAPTVGEEGERGELRVERGCHPLLLASDEEAVPFDLALEPGEKVLLVSGPNAGGKTVLLKTLGLLSALAQSGIVPPCGPGTRLPLFRDFFAIIGDEQSIEASLSTFSAQVSLLRNIIVGSDGRSMVLLDEFGSHTDPSEGAALAGAALLRLAGQAALTVATTHLGGLKALAGEDPRVVNASLEFDRRELRPTFRLRRDRPGRSYALEIAERLGLPGEVLEAARDRLRGGERRMEALLAELEEREEELSRLSREARRGRDEVEDERGRLEERSRALDRREREIERAARERAEEYLLDARSRVEETIRRLESGEEEATAARAEVERAIEESREATPEPPREEREPPDLSPGDTVRIRELDRRGRVREVRGDRAVVEVGGMRLKLPARDVDPVEGEAEPEDDRAPRREESRPDLEARQEVDLRGLRVEEVEGTLLPALDAAVVAGLPSLRVIHGRGTGALRRRVGAILAEDSRVRDVRPGELWEGGTGVTIAELGEEEAETG